jgi:hypothetical protein
MEIVFFSIPFLHFFLFLANLFFPMVFFYFVKKKEKKMKKWSGQIDEKIHCFEQKRIQKLFLSSFYFEKEERK